MRAKPIWANLGPYEAIFPPPTGEIKSNGDFFLRPNLGQFTGRMPVCPVAGFLAMRENRHPGRGPCCRPAKEGEGVESLSNPQAVAAALGLTLDAVEQVA